MKTLLNLVGLIGLVASTSWAQTVPSLVNYQGKLTNDSGDPLSNRTYEVEFRLWDDTEAVGGTLIWGEKYNIFVSEGSFNVLLGSGGTQVTNPTLPAVNDIAFAFSDPSRYLGLTLLTDEGGSPILTPEEIVPRQQILSTPFAIHADYAAHAGIAALASNATHAVQANSASNADDADTLDGVDGPDFVQEADMVHGDSTHAEVPAWNGSDFSRRSRVMVSTSDDLLLGKSGDLIDTFELWNDDIRSETTQQVWLNAGDDVELGADDKIILRGANEVLIEGPVRMFTGMVDKTAEVNYVAEADGFVMVYIFNKQIDVIIGGVVFSMETDESDGSNDNASACFPVAKGETYKVHVVASASGSALIYKWRALNRALSPQS